MSQKVSKIKIEGNGEDIVKCKVVCSDGIIREVENKIEYVRSGMSRISYFIDGRELREFGKTIFTGYDGNMKMIEDDFDKFCCEVEKFVGGE